MPLNIVVLVKPVPDPKTPVAIGAGGSLDLRGVKYVVNPGDKSAVEAALRLRESLGGRVIGLSLALPELTEVFREVLAMGADVFIHIADPAADKYDTLLTSYILSMGVKKIEKEYGRADIILCGAESSDTNTGHIGPQVGEWLGVPSISYVERIIEVRDNRVTVRRIIEGGYAVMSSRTPVVLTVTETGYEPRIPSLRETILARRKPITVWRPADIGVTGPERPSTILAHVRPVETRRLGKIFYDENIDKMIDRFLEELRRDGVSLIR